MREIRAIIVLLKLLFSHGPRIRNPIGIGVDVQGYITKSRYTPYDVRGLHIAFLGIYGIISCHIRMYYELKYTFQRHPSHYRPNHESSSAPRDDRRTIPLSEEILSCGKSGAKVFISKNIQFFSIKFGRRQANFCALLTLNNKKI